MLQETSIEIPNNMDEFCIGHSFFHFIYSKMYNEVNTV